MKRSFFVLSAIVLLFSHTSCLKDKNCKNKSVSSEEATINSYAATNGMTGVTHSSGVYYQVVSAGGGATPGLSSQVTVNYVGKYLDGTIFSQSTSPATFALSETIPGFQIALQQIQKGGTVRFVVPSSLAYACAGRDNIPPNTILYFEVQLINVF